MKKYLLIGFLFLVHVTLKAQVIEQLSPQERKQLTKVTEPITLYKGLLRAGLSANFMVQDKFFDVDRKKTFYEGNFSGYAMASIFSLQYGITDRLEITASLPYYNLKNSGSYTFEIPYTDEIETQKTIIRSTGLGDIMASLRYQLIQHQGNSPSLTFGFTFHFPTGKNGVTDYKGPRDYDGAISKGEWAISPEFKIRKVSYPFSFEFGAIVTKYFGANKTLLPDTEPVKIISGIEMLIVPQINFHLNEWVSMSHSLDYYLAKKDDFDGEDAFGYHNNQYDQWVVRYYPSITFQVKQLRLEQVVLIPLAGKVFTADPSFYFIAQYTF